MIKDNRAKSDKTEPRSMKPKEITASDIPEFNKIREDR